MMAHQLLEASVELALLADEHCVDGGLHVVVDAALAGSFEELERLFVRVEHHLLALARISPHERHPAMAKTHVRYLRHSRHTVDDDTLVAPVELVGLAWLEHERHVRLGPPRALALGPGTAVSAHGVDPPLVAETNQQLAPAVPTARRAWNARSR